MEWTKERIRELRLRMGWSQSDLARHTNTETGTIYQMEQGQASVITQIKPELDLLWHQAESLSQELRMMSQVERFLDVENRTQAFTSELGDLPFSEKD